MIRFYTMRIIEKKTTFDKVPEPLKAAVAASLVEQGYSHLIQEA